MDAIKTEADIECPSSTHTWDTAVGEVVSGITVRDKDFGVGDSIYARLQRLAGKYGMEQRGIEQVPNDEREEASAFKIGAMVRDPEIAPPLLPP
jgi:hypothetical protein